MHKCTMAFKYRNGFAPPYRIDSFNPNTFNHSYSTRNSSNIWIPIARTEYYNRVFLISGCNAWNNLPDYIRTSVSLNSFKFNMFKYLLAKTQFWIQLYQFLVILIILSVNSICIYCIYKCMNVCKWCMSGSASKTSILQSVLPRLNNIFNHAINQCLEFYWLRY